MDTIGNRIKHLRKVEGLKQKEFANRLLVSQSYLSGLENNNETPTEKLIKLICYEFHINEIWLTDNIGEMYDSAYLNYGIPNLRQSRPYDFLTFIKYLGFEIKEVNAQKGITLYGITGSVFQDSLYLLKYPDLLEIKDIVSKFTANLIMSKGLLSNDAGRIISEMNDNQKTTVEDKNTDE